MIIVTGGAGFIGSAIVWTLNQENRNDIVIVDHLGSSEKWKNLRGLRFQDYIEKEVFREKIRQNKIGYSIDAIFHMGACSSTTELDASYLVDNNFQYTKELATYAIENDSRFVYASSAATYGDGEMGYDDNHSGIYDLSPLNMYGYSKHMFDLWAYQENLLSKIVGLKFSNIFGPNEYHKDNMRSVIKKSYEQIKTNGKVKLFKSYKPEYQDGEQKRDFLYVKDAAYMCLFFLDKPKINGLFNIGSGSANTWNQLIQYVFSGLQLKPNIEYIEMPDELRDRYQYFTELNMDKLKAAGYDKTAQDLEASVHEYVDHYLRNDRYLC